MPINSIGIAIDHRPPSGDRRIKAQEPSAETRKPMPDSRPGETCCAMRPASSGTTSIGAVSGRMARPAVNASRPWMTMNQIGR